MCIRDRIFIPLRTFSYCHPCCCGSGAFHGKAKTNGEIGNTSRTSRTFTFLIHIASYVVKHTICSIARAFSLSSSCECLVCVFSGPLVQLMHDSLRPLNAVSWSSRSGDHDDVRQRATSQADATDGLPRATPSHRPRSVTIEAASQQTSRRVCYGRGRRREGRSEHTHRWGRAIRS